ncbi:MAG: OmpA family protein [Candidatus Omnitrophica bacterium]|nr:OmpA family protein [Candidatus Omnitrophota bacterium]MBI2495048.1 OmpA family protein [Candidatus Omnitrophota bacterium]MBI3021142.1 OmpA family protein [Candidatus Omnitrophota bacterium]
MNRRMGAALAAIALVITTGCAVNLAKRSPWDIQQLSQLSDQLEQFKTLAQLKAEEADQLRAAKALLEQRLSSSEASVGYDERGLVARMLDQVLFDSGKASLRRGAFTVLDTVAQVLQQFPEQHIGIEGHTDNQPIRHSGWVDNKALSLARANAVADYLVEKRGVSRGRITVSGYGEERPIASNDAADGRQRNRRVEIVILPRSSQEAYQAEAGQAAQGRATSSK